MASTIEILLTYYDKAYLQSIEKRREKVIKTIQWNGEVVLSAAAELLLSNK